MIEGPQSGRSADTSDARASCPGWRQRAARRRIRQATGARAGCPTERRASGMSPRDAHGMDLARPHGLKAPCHAGCGGAVSRIPGRRIALRRSTVRVGAGRQKARLGPGVLRFVTPAFLCQINLNRAPSTAHRFSCKTPIRQVSIRARQPTRESHQTTNLVIRRPERRCWRQRTISRTTLEMPREHSFWIPPFHCTTALGSKFKQIRWRPRLLTTLWRTLACTVRESDRYQSSHANRSRVSNAQKSPSA